MFGLDACVHHSQTTASGIHHSSSGPGKNFLYCVHLAFSSPVHPAPRALSPSRGDDWATAAAQARSQVFVGPFAGDEDLPGMPAPFAPLLLCETESPNPNLSYLVICIRI